VKQNFLQGVVQFRIVTELGASVV